MAKKIEYSEAWDVACSKNDPDGLKKLIDAGLNVNMESEYGERLLQACVASRLNTTTDCLEVLLKAGADTRHFNEEQTHCLIYACERTEPTQKKYIKTNGVLRYIEMLIDAGADPHCIDKYGNGMLYHACFNGHEDAFNHFLDIGVVDVANHAGETAEDFCNKCAETVEYPDGNKIFGNNDRLWMADALKLVRENAEKPKYWEGEITMVVKFHESFIEADNEEDAKEKIQEEFENHLHRRAEVQSVTAVSVQPDEFNNRRSLRRDRRSQ